MKAWLVLILLVGLTGCGGGPIVNPAKIKHNQQARMKNSGNEVKDQTGIDLGTATPSGKRKLRNILSAPVDP